MKEKLEVLIELQLFETEVSRLTGVLEKIPGKIEALDLTFMDLKQKIAEKTEFISHLKKEYRAREVEVETNISRIKKSRGKMDAVKTNKEYQSILKEIQDLEDKNSLIEDEMLAALDMIEGGQGELNQLNGEMGLLEKNVAAQKTALQNEDEEVKEHLSRVIRQRDGQIQSIDIKLLDTFNRVKARVGGLVVVPVTKSVCKGCHLMIPPQVYNELQRQDSLKFCPHCHRIIYWMSEEN